MEVIAGALERRGTEVWLEFRGEGSEAGREKTGVLLSLKESSTSCTVIPDITMAVISFSTAFPPALSSSPSFFTSTSFRDPARAAMEFAASPPAGTSEEGGPDVVYLEIVSKLNW